MFYLNVKVYWDGIKLTMPKISRSNARLLTHIQILLQKYQAKNNDEEWYSTETQWLHMGL